MSKRLIGEVAIVTASTKGIGFGTEMPPWADILMSFEQLRVV
jgi:hypothetical protein